MTNSKNLRGDPRRLFFLIYDSRSGSTLLSSQLDAHKDIVVTTESNFMRLLLEQQKQLKGATTSEKILTILRCGERIAQLDLPDRLIAARLPSSGPYSISSVAQALSEAYADHIKPEAKNVIIKDGANGYWINQITQHLPEAGFIHILRDGRAVFNSKRFTERPYAPGKIMARDTLTAARHWRSFVNHVHGFTKLHPEKILTVCFEDLLKYPDRTVATVYRSLGLPADNNASSTEYSKRIPAKESAIHQKITKEVDATRIDAWRQEVPTSELYVFDYLCRRTLERHGYEPISRGASAVTLLNTKHLAVILQSLWRRLASWMRLAFSPTLTWQIVKWKFLRLKG
ncbi:MAG: sulfotransferase [Proteobacteria bacterium]|nr:sulfotransferase [Pseudomonadota bacterium]